ncbi:MAG: TetR/AcrR family transcriptional regulator, partial [Solirubrobacterales bacterium]|nr:TetR/AcrR family transcriptional regulator [Solirubrobacterales bacterium]
MSDEADRPATASPKREAIQSAVLHATEDLLAEGASFADLNIEKIATRAGISRTAF